MKRCLELGEIGLGTTAPNPMVGAVLVYNGLIIGEGFTSPYGGPHAEVNAINSVVNKEFIAKATLYVSLEPCSHFGKTPPCASLIIEKNIPNVVVGIKDPHIKVAGKGITALKLAGCNVVVGVLEKECRLHFKRFLCFQEKKRPFIILKWAQTADFFIAPLAEMRSNSPEPFWITTSLSQQLVHKWRAEEQAILVGTTTVIKDNPKLDVRHVSGNSPMRFILDLNGKLNANYNVFNEMAPTVVITTKENTLSYASHIQIAYVDCTLSLAESICNILFFYNITSVIIEGGTRTIQSFIDKGLWDQAKVLTGETFFNNGIEAPKLNASYVSKKSNTNDQLTIYENI